MIDLLSCCSTSLAFSSCFVLCNYYKQHYKTQHRTPYHCSEHAFHVALSVNKLIDLMLQTDPETTKTFGLRHDPLAQFAMLFAALIHDVEHKVRNDLRRQGKRKPHVSYLSNTKYVFVFFPHFCSLGRPQPPARDRK
jgi:3'5'-cyclic nucleotide phosphodiesterase